MCIRDRVIYLDKSGNRFNPSPDGGEVFKPEKGYQAEVGVRYMWGNRLPGEETIWYYAHEQDKVKRLCNDMTELLEKKLARYLNEH